MASARSPSSLFANTLQLCLRKRQQTCPMIRATAGACRMLVIEASYDGSDRDRIRRYASAEDTVFVVFGGRIYAEQPTLLTVSDYLWSRFQRQLGLRAEATPVLFRHSERRAVRLNDCLGTNLDKRSI